MQKTILAALTAFALAACGAQPQPSLPEGSAGGARAGAPLFTADAVSGVWDGALSDSGVAMSVTFVLSENEGGDLTGVFHSAGVSEATTPVSGNRSTGVVAFHGHSRSMVCEGSFSAEGYQGECVFEGRGGKAQGGLWLARR